MRVRRFLAPLALGVSAWELAGLILPASHETGHVARSAMTPPGVSGAPRRSGASVFAVARAARARGPRAVLRTAPAGCPLRSLSLAAGALHCKRATAKADAPMALVTPAGCARRRRESGATRELWVNGLWPESWCAMERSKQTASWPLASGRGRERCEMARYKSDPRWITVKFKGDRCARFGRLINPGERGFYYPEDRSLYCESEACGKAASREFGARACDEENNRCM